MICRATRNQKKTSLQNLNVHSIALMPRHRRQETLNGLSSKQLKFYATHWPFWARPDQLPPSGEWLIWLLLGGRGSGKTRAGAEWIRSRVEGPTPLQKGRSRHVALVGETLLAVREVMIEGPSGLRRIAPPETRPEYIASRHLLVWPNGASAHVFSAERPDSLRGPQFDIAWSDELTKWRHVRQCWDMLQFGLRLGSQPQQVVTTTPRPIELLKQIMANPRSYVTRSSTYANKAHLAPGFVEELRRVYEGTRLGRQEIDAEIIEDVVGALWTADMIDAARVDKAPPLSRIVVAVDPPATSGPKADACGICIAGCTAVPDDGATPYRHGYILADATVQGWSPARWGQRVVELYRHYNADRVVAEINQGGDMVRQIVLQQGPEIAYRGVRATRGKMARAEPVAALYERGLVHHVGVHDKLEKQLCEYNGQFSSQSEKSPDRLDALVWALTDLMLGGAPQAQPKLRQI